MGRRLERLLRPKRSEEEKHLIDMAKKGLMERHHISEEEAHRLLQKRSMDNGTRMAQSARLLLEEWKSAQEKD
jgi:response regulator NasT